MRKGPLVSAVVVSNLLVRSLDLANVGRANAANLAQDLDRALDRGLTPTLTAISLVRLRAI